MWLKLLKTCASEADKIALHYYSQKNINIKQKEDLSPVTAADLEIEKKIREQVKAEFPKMEIYGEEFGACAKDAALKLIIDPIDGTINFVKNIPIFATLLAIEENGEVVAGLVSMPYSKERWWAAKGQGSFYNNEKIAVSNVNQLSESQVFHGSLSGREATELPANFENLIKSTARQRGFGDFYNHVLVAQGSGEFACDFGFQPWDIAPLGLIVEEAGGQFSDIHGKKDIYSGSIITSNGLFHQQILDLLN
jgi:histidinol-phosphatase